MKSQQWFRNKYSYVQSFKNLLLIWSGSTKIADISFVEQTSTSLVLIIVLYLPRAVNT